MNKSYYFTDPRPRVLVIGYVEVLRDGGPVNVSGALGFNGNDFNSNHSWWDGGDGLHEAVAFVSGRWFAGHIYAGERRLEFVRFSGGPRLLFKGCGSNVARFPDWNTPLDLSDSTKAYYLGHITYNVVPFETLLIYGGRLEATVRDLSDQYENELRALIGERKLSRAMAPGCPE